MRPRLFICPRINVGNKSSNGRHYGLNIFKPEKNLEFFRLKF